MERRLLLCHSLDATIALEFLKVNLGFVPHCSIEAGNLPEKTELFFGNLPGKSGFFKEIHDHPYFKPG